MALETAYYLGRPCPLFMFCRGEGKVEVGTNESGDEDRRSKERSTSAMQPLPIATTEPQQAEQWWTQPESSEMPWPPKRPMMLREEQKYNQTIHHTMRYLYVIPKHTLHNHSVKDGEIQ